MKLKLYEEFVDTLVAPETEIDTKPLMIDDEESSELLSQTNVKFDGNVYTITDWSIY